MLVLDVCELLFVAGLVFVVLDVVVVCLSYFCVWVVVWWAFMLLVRFVVCFILFCVLLLWFLCALGC